MEQSYAQFPLFKEAVSEYYIYIFFKLYWILSMTQTKCFDFKWSRTNQTYLDL